MVEITSPGGIQGLMSWEKHELIAKICELTVHLKRKSAVHETEQYRSDRHTKDVEWDMKKVQKKLDQFQHENGELRHRIDKIIAVVELLHDLGEIDEKILNIFLKVLKS